MHTLDGSVPGEPPVALGLVDGPAVIRSLGTGHLLEDRRANTAPDSIRGQPALSYPQYQHGHPASLTAGSQFSRHRVRQDCLLAIRGL